MSSAWSRQHRLDGPAGAVVSRYVDYRLTGFEPGVHAGLPSRYLTLLMSFDEPIELVDGDGKLVGRHRALIAGLHSSATYVRHSGTQIGLQLGLDPTTAGPVLGVGVAELAAGSFDLDAVVSGGDRLVERVAEASPDDRIAIIEQAFSADAAETSVPEIDRAWSLLAASHGRTPVSDIAREVGWSRRHLSERFRSALGWSMSDARRVLRFERAHRMFLDGHPQGWAGVAADAGYSDQPHLVREWKRITGSSPTRWADEEELPFVQDGDGEIGQNHVHV